MLAYYTSSQVDTLLGDYRTRTAQDAETAGAITAALLAYYTSSQVDALLGDYRTASMQDTQTQAAITGALLAYRTGPDQDVFTTNQITSALVAYRSAADQDTATASSIAAALLSYYTIAQVDGLLAGGGLGPANSRTLSGRRRGRRGGGRHRRADPGPHGRLAVKLDGSPQQRLQRGPGHAHRGSERGRLHPDPSGEPVEHRAHLQLDARARAALRLRYRLGTASNFVVYMSEADNVYDPLYGSFVGDQGAWSTAKMYFTVPPNKVAKLHFGAHFRRQHGGGGHGGFGPAAEARVPRRRGRRRHPWARCCWNPRSPRWEFFCVASASFAVGGFQLEGYAMTLSAFAWNIVRTYTLTPGRRYSFGCRYRLGTASNLVMYVSAADNDYVGVTGTFLGTPSQGVWSTARLDFSAPPGGIAKLHFGAFGGSIPGLVQQSAGTLDLYSMQIRASAFEGPRWTGSPRKATWAATSCCATT